VQNAVLLNVCLLLQDLVQSCLRGEGGILEDYLQDLGAS
jgi:hypothetical protein